MASSEGRREPQDKTRFGVVVRGSAARQGSAVFEWAAPGSSSDLPRHQSIEQRAPRVPIPFASRPPGTIAQTPSPPRQALALSPTPSHSALHTPRRTPCPPAQLPPPSAPDLHTLAAVLLSAPQAEQARRSAPTILRSSLAGEGRIESGRTTGSALRSLAWNGAGERVTYEPDLLCSERDLRLLASQQSGKRGERTRGT